MGGPTPAYQYLSLGMARGGGDLRTVRPCDGRRRKANRCGAAADQQPLAGFEPEAAKERTPSGLEHLRQGAEPVPREVAPEHTDLPRRHAGVFGVPAVEDPAHAAHDRCDRLACHELATGRRRDRPDGLDSQNARKNDAWRVALSCEQLGAVQAERLDPDEHLAPLRHGNGPVLDCQRLGAAGCVQHYRPHGRRDGHGVVLKFTRSPDLQTCI